MNEEGRFKKRHHVKTTETEKIQNDLKEVEKEHSKYGEIYAQKTFIQMFRSNNLYSISRW